MANIQRMTPKRLGEIFTHSGLISSEQLEEALEAQEKTGKHLGEILVDRGYVTERDVAEAIATQFSLPYLSPTQYYIPSDMLKAIPIAMMREHQMVPIDKLGKILMLVIAGPVENVVLEGIEQMTGSTLQIYVGKFSDVTEAIDKLAETGKVRRKEPTPDAEAPAAEPEAEDDAKADAKALRDMLGIDSPSDGTAPPDDDVSPEEAAAPDKDA